jgi:hypothetical protein
MTQHPSTIDPKALSSLVDLWLDRAMEEDPEDISGLDFDLGSSTTALHAVGLWPNDTGLTAASGFEIGFGLALRVALAVLADPIGNPMPKVEAAITSASAAVAEFRREVPRAQ